MDKKVGVKTASERETLYITGIKCIFRYKFKKRSPGSTLPDSASKHKAGPGLRRQALLIHRRK